MVQRTPVATAALYEVDETAWLEATAELIRNGRLSEVELNTLAEYLTDMAKRDRRFNAALSLNASLRCSTPYGITAGIGTVRGFTW